MHAIIKTIRLEKHGFLTKTSDYYELNVSVKPLEKPKKRPTLKSIILRRCHILQWLPHYSKGDVVADFIAGLSVGLTMMPQSIAYASLAGLPAQYGLYTAFIGSFTYVFFGTIKEVSIGPTSLMALLTFSYTEGLPVDFVILLSFLAGCVEFLMGILNLGFLVDFISPCVTSGFTSAMAVSVVVSQLKNLLGVRNLKNHGVFDVFAKLIARRDEISLSDTSLGLGCIAFLFVFKQFPKIPTRNRLAKKALWFLSISKNALIVLITAVLAYCLSEYHGLRPFVLSGNVPSGMPQVRVPHFTTKIGNETVGFFEMVGTLHSSILVLPMAAVLANVAIAKAFSKDVVVDATQEMMTLGLCNIFGSFFQAIPSCGAFTRSAVASTSGVRTPLQGIYSGSIIILALSFLTPYFYFIPRTTLAAVLISAIMTMFDYEIFPKLWRCNKFDFYLTLATLIMGSLYGVEIGMISGALINIIILLKTWTRPRITSEIHLDSQGNEYIYMKPELGVYYPAIDFMTTSVAKAHKIASNLPIVIDCISFIRLDYPSCKMLENLLSVYNEKPRKLTLINLSGPMYSILSRTINEEALEKCRSNENRCDSKSNGSDSPFLTNPSIQMAERKMSEYDNV